MIGRASLLYPAGCDWAVSMGQKLPMEQVPLHPLSSAHVLWAHSTQILEEPADRWDLASTTLPSCLMLSRQVWNSASAEHHGPCFHQGPPIMVGEKDAWGPLPGLLLICCSWTISLLQRKDFLGCEIYRPGDGQFSHVLTLHTHTLFFFNATTNAGSCTQNSLYF